MKAVLQLLGAGLLHLGAALVLGHLRALLADHLLVVVDVVLQLVLLVAQRRQLFRKMLDQVPPWSCPGRGPRRSPTRQNSVEASHW